jgi:uncharacterized membrane protein (UPF0127 family)
MKGFEFLTDFNYIYPRLSRVVCPSPAFAFDLCFWVWELGRGGLLKTMMIWKPVKIGLQEPKAMKRLAGQRMPFFIFFFIALFALPPGAISQESDRKFMEITIKGTKLKAEVAKTEEDKAKGLMFREKLGKDEGMLFVYDKEARLSFWIKNTRIPLSIAFLDKNGRIVDLQDMVPFSLETHISALPAQYALEMNQGWFQQHGISIGDTAKFSALTKK